jgi:serine/threonine protein kinase
MLAGSPPFPGDDVDEIGAQHLHATPPPLADARPAVPPALDDLVRRLLAKDVAGRPPTAAAVAAELARLRQE